MENLLLKKYDDKTELEKLKIFLQETEFYSNLIGTGVPPKKIYELIDEKFLDFLSNKEILDELMIKMDNKKFNYEEERESFGIGIELDALVYACDKTAEPIDDIPQLVKIRNKMIVRDR